MAIAMLAFCSCGIPLPSRGDKGPFDGHTIGSSLSGRIESASSPSQPPYGGSDRTAIDLASRASESQWDIPSGSLKYVQENIYPEHPSSE
jgi:hypothetical protein